MRQTVRDPKQSRSQNVTGYALTAAVVAAGAPPQASKYSNPWFVAKPVHLGIHVVPLPKFQTRSLQAILFPPRSSSI